MTGDGAFLQTQIFWRACASPWNSSLPLRHPACLALSPVPPPNLHMPSSFAAPQLIRQALPHPSAFSSGTERDQELEPESDWESEMLDDFDPMLYLNPGRRRTGRSRNEKVGATVAGVVSAESDDFSWAEQARNRACVVAEERNPKAASFLKKKILTEASKKGARRKRGRQGQALKDTLQLPRRRVDASLRKPEEKDNVSETNDAKEFDDLRKQTQERAQAEQVNEREKAFNRRLVEAVSAQEVLEIVGSALERARSLGTPSLLSPFNTATALHKIGKHMESSGMSKSDRLAFARKRDMAELVGRAMEGLQGCSAQGLSNIAWALSKVGGSSLYFSELDLIAGVALDKISNFNTQNIANTAGAFASMQHLVPSLFASLAIHASGKAQSFKPQELAQVLWAFATLHQPLDPLLGALDCMFPLVRQESMIIDPKSGCEFTDRSVTRLDAGSNCIEDGPSMPSNGSCVDGSDRELIIGHAAAGRYQASKFDKKTYAIAEAEDTVTMGKALQSLDPGCCVMGSPLDNATVKQLANCAWSYAILNQIERPSFYYLWQKVDSLGARIAEDNSLRSSYDTVPFLSQVHQVNLCLQYEYPHLGLTLKSVLRDLALEAWEKYKSDSLSTSVYQKDVDWLLVSTGQKWVAEYTAADYSLDLVLEEEKIAIEFDGPSHFARNTGSLLGNAVLKRRLLSCAGWTILSIPFQEWEELDGEAEQRHYLKELLESTGRMDSVSI